MTETYENASSTLEQTLLQMENTIKEIHLKQNQKINHLWNQIQSPQLLKKTSSQENSMKTSTFNQNKLPLQDASLKHFIKTGLSLKSLTSSPDSAGYMVSPSMQEYLHQLPLYDGSIRSLARVTNIESDSYDVLKDKKAPIVGWVQEGDTRSETESPAMHHFKIPVHTLYAKPLISQKLLDDSFMDAEEWLIENIASSMMKAENKSFISGDGVHQPKGILTHQRIDVGLGEYGFIEEIKTGVMGQIPSIDVFYQAIEAMPTHYLKGAVWYVSRSALTQIRRLKTTDGMPLWQPSLIEGQPQYLCGYPVILSDEMPPLHDGKASSSIIFANFKEGYQIVDRQDLNLLRDPYSSKPFVEFYATKRLGGDVIDFNAFKIISCTE